MASRMRESNLRPKTMVIQCLEADLAKQSSNNLGFSQHEVLFEPSITKITQSFRLAFDNLKAMLSHKNESGDINKSSCYRTRSKAIESTKAQQAAVLSC